VTIRGSALETSPRLRGAGRRPIHSGGGGQLAERGGDVRHQVVQVRNQVPVGVEAEVQVPEVAEDGDPESLPPTG
jgi:hypothetical protein